MSPQFVPLSADRSKAFFDENGERQQMAKCPTCKRTTRFDYVSDGDLIHFTGADCGHGFEVKSKQ